MSSSNTTPLSTSIRTDEVDEITLLTRQVAKLKRRVALLTVDSNFNLAILGAVVFFLLVITLMWLFNLPDPKP